MPERREKENDGLNPLCAGDPLAGELARLVPVPPGFDRAALLFAAGAAARSASVTRWRAATAASILVAAGAWGFALLSPDDTPNETTTRDVTTPIPDTHRRPTAPSPGEPLESAAGQLVVTFVDDTNPGDRVRGLRLRNDILAAGLGVIPSAARPGNVSPTTLAEVEKALGLPAGTFAVPMATPPKPKSNEPD